MANETNIGGDKKEQAQLLSNTLFDTFAYPVGEVEVDGKMVRVANGFGETQRYLLGKFTELREKSLSYLEDVKALETEAEYLKDVISSDYDGSHTLSEQTRYAKVQEGLRELREPVAMPSADSLVKIESFARTADISINQMKLQRYQYQNWDRLNEATQDHFFGILAEKFKNQSISDKIDDEHKKSNWMYNSESTLSAYDSRSELPPLNAESTSLLNQIIGKKEVVEEWKPAELQKNTLELYTFMDSEIANLGNAIGDSVEVKQVIVDRLMGEYSNKSMTNEEIEAAIDVMWEGYATRTTINSAAGLVGMGLTTPAIKLIGLTGKAAIPTASAYVSSQTGIVLTETGAAQFIAGQGMQKISGLMPGVVKTIGSKTNGLSMGLAGGFLAEGPIDMGLSAAYEQSGDLSLQNFGLDLPVVSQEEIEEMTKKEVYAGHNPFTKASLWMGYDKAFMHTPDLYLQGKTIPSLGVDAKDYEAGLRGENTEVAEQIAAMNDAYERLNTKHSINHKIHDYYKAEADKLEQGVQTQQYGAVSPTEINNQAGNNENNVAANGINGR